ncbi:MAG: c-type cytochrome [Castellaniella sp.]
MKRVLSSMVVAGSMLLGVSAAGVAVAQEGPVAPDAAKGQELYANGDLTRGILSCASCHGDAGNSKLSANPNLAGQAHEYLVKQLVDFTKREGDDKPARLGVDGNETVMTMFATLLTEEDRNNIAYWLAQQPLDMEEAPTATVEATMEHGQQIWRGGLADRRVPACAACHGPAGAGVPGEFPRLAGQFPEYIAEQLRLFRSGDRKDAVMFDIADRMSDADIAAVADYAAGLR